MRLIDTRFACSSKRAGRRATHRPGFTILELKVVVGAIAIAGSLLTAISEERQRVARERTLAGLLQAFQASADHYDGHGELVRDVNDLQPYLPPELFQVVSGGEPFHGSTITMTSGSQDVTFQTRVNNYMLATQTHTLTFGEGEIARYRQTGQKPETVSQADPVALARYTATMQEVDAQSLDAARCAAALAGEEISEADARLMMAQAWNDRSEYEAARSRVDVNGDGDISTSEISDGAWAQSLYPFQDCAQSYLDVSLELMLIEPDEPDVAVTTPQYAPYEDTRLLSLIRQVDQINAGAKSRNGFPQLDAQFRLFGANTREADLRGALQNVRTLTRQLTGLTTGGQISSQLGSRAIETAQNLEHLFAAALAPQVDPNWPYQGSVQLRVDARAKLHKDTDGSAEDPFPDLVLALAYAEFHDFPAVSIRVRRGTYRGPLDITRPTRIIGELQANARPLIRGVLLNTGPHQVKLHNLRLTSEDPIPGTIVVVHPDAITYLEDVRVEDALGVGILQSGGSFRCSGLEVVGTRPYSAEINGEQLTFGVGMQLEGGNEARLRGVVMSHNHATALMLHGEDTIADVARMWITHTTIDGSAEDAPDPVALQVRNGAHLTGDIVYISGDNAENSVGLYVDDWASASLYYTMIDSCHRNVFVGNDGSLELVRFTLRDAHGCGINIMGGAEVELSGVSSKLNSMIKDCSTGVCLDGFEFPNDDVGPYVDLIRNEAQVRRVSLPVPSPVTVFQP